MTRDPWAERLAKIEAEILRQIDLDAPKFTQEVEKEAARLQRQIDDANPGHRAFATHGEVHRDRTREDREPIGYDSRRDFVPKEQEDRYLTRDEKGLPTLRLVDTGYRLAITSPLAGAP